MNGESRVDSPTSTPIIAAPSAARGNETLSCEERATSFALDAVPDREQSLDHRRPGTSLPGSVRADTAGSCWEYPSGIAAGVGARSPWPLMVDRRTRSLLIAVGVGFRSS
jgi:hypothetical protein